MAVANNDILREQQRLIDEANKEIERMRKETLEKIKGAGR